MLLRKLFKISTANQFILQFYLTIILSIMRPKTDTSKNFSRKKAEMHYSSIFQKCKTMRYFFALWDEKNILWTFWEISENPNQNSVGKLNFLLLLDKLLLNIEPSEITSFFHNIFFQFRGRNVPPPLAAPMILPIYLLLLNYALSFMNWPICDFPF